MTARTTAPPLPDTVGVLLRSVEPADRGSAVAARALRGARDERRLADALARRAADRAERRAERAADRAVAARRRAEGLAVLARA
jgi:hypothetical protein